MMLWGCCLGGFCRVDGGRVVVLWWCCVDAVVFWVSCRWWWCVDAVVMMLLCRWWCVDGVVGWVCGADSVLMVICRWCSDDGIVLMVMCRWCCDDEDEAEGGGGSGRRRPNSARKTKTSQSDGGKNWCLILLWQLHCILSHCTRHCVMQSCFGNSDTMWAKSEKRGAIPPLHYLSSGSACSQVFSLGAKHQEALQQIRKLYSLHPIDDLLPAFDHGKWQVWNCFGKVFLNIVTNMFLRISRAS